MGARHGSFTLNCGRSVRRFAARLGARFGTRQRMPTSQGISKDLGFRGVSRGYDHPPLLRLLMVAIRFFMLATAGFDGARWFPLRVPVKGKSNTG